jgi:FAD dependent oxidoreductase
VRALRRAAEAGSLTANCGRAWVDVGAADDEAYVKLFVPIPDDWREREGRGELTRAAAGDQAAVVAFLRRLPEFAAAEVVRTGELGVRDGGRVRGEYCLTGADVRGGRRFADAACRCSWPIEYWDPDQGVSMEYLPENGCYEIPLRALKAQGLRNVWIAGKCLSADRAAQASARVVGTCWAMGEAAGRAAAAV